MKRYFVDSNLFIRLFAKDDPKQFRAAMALMREAEDGAVELVTGPPVFFETAWTLKIAYRTPADHIVRCLMSMCGIKGLEIIDRDLVESALKVCEEKDVSFADAYIWISCSDIAADAVATFNAKDFKRAGAAIFEP